MENSYNVLRSRIDRFGVAQPNIQNLEGQMGRIMVELPGIKEPDRIRKLLQGSANLEFWETYDASVVIPYLVALDSKLVKGVSADSTAEDAVKAAEEKDKDNNISKVIITTPKTKNANREIPINKEFLELLKKIKTKGDDYIITGSSKYLEPRTYRKYFNKVLKQVKIKQFNFHSLRHTFATNCISLGVDYKTVSELLGHANVNITLNLYVHPRLSQKKKCIDMICKVFQESI